MSFILAMYIPLEIVCVYQYKTKLASCLACTCADQIREKSATSKFFSLTHSLKKIFQEEKSTKSLKRHEKYKKENKVSFHHLK